MTLGSVRGFRSPLGLGLLGTVAQECCGLTGLAQLCWGELSPGWSPEGNPRALLQPGAEVQLMLWSALK